MLIAIDGGAFQQGLAAGIFNVAVGLLNAVTNRRPDIEFILVLDSCFGPIREDLMARLRVKPRIYYAQITPGTSRSARYLTSKDPGLTFEIDKIKVPAELKNGKAVYKGPAPTSSFRILSRADTPSAIEGSGDARHLGVLVSQITIQTAEKIIHVNMGDQRLNLGFHGLEWGVRWTNGEAELPLDIFPSFDGNVEVEISIENTMSYRIGSGLFDGGLQQISSHADRLSLQAMTAKAESDLIAFGAKAYITNHFIPAQFSILKQYSILYDLIPVLYPEFFYADARENFANNLTVFKSSAHVFSISEASKQDLMRWSQVPSSKITAMMIDADPNFKRRPDSDIEDVRNRYLPGGVQYIISVGTLEPRKNHAKLVEAFRAVLDSGVPSFDLVLVGKQGWGTGDLLHKIESLGLTGRIHHLHDVSNDDLAALYSGAIFSVYPSLYEGFGLPVLESMACGCPVITSNRSSMLEIAGDAALLVDPTSLKSLVKGIYTLLVDAQQRERLTRLGYEQRKKFSWDATADRVLDGMELI